MKASTGVGIAGLSLAIIGAVLPIVGLWIGWVALIIVFVAALMGERGLTIATVILSAVVFLFLTPSLWLTGSLEVVTPEGQYSEPAVPQIALAVSIVLLIAPIVGMILFSTGKLALGKRKPPQSD